MTGNRKSESQDPRKTLSREARYATLRVMTNREVNLSRRSFLRSALMASGAALLTSPVFGADSHQPSLPKLKGNRFLTFNTVVRVNQIEVSRNRNAGEDEGNLHTLASVRKLRDCFERGFPGGRMTWAFSWLALQDQRPNYQAIRKQVVEYHHSLWRRDHLHSRRLLCPDV